MFVGYDSWVEQYFKDIKPSDDIVICCSDSLAWKNNPDHNWVYNKLALCKSQGIDSAPHGVKPEFEPIFSKPIINLYGKNRYAYKIFNWVDAEYHPGHFWMPVFSGTHLSTDMIIIDGKRAWSYTMQAYEDDNGCISRYESANTDFPELVDKITIWALQHLTGYTGVVNVETINGKIIDCHLRMTPRFVDLYDDDWLDSVVTLYEKGTWNCIYGHKNGVSYTLRAAEEGSYVISDKEAFDNLRQKAQSVQVIFKEGESMSLNDRLLIVNGQDAQEVNEIINEFSKIIILTEE